MGPGPRWRLFLAALLPDAIREALDEPIAQLGALAPLVNPSRLDAIHLTLHFIGDVETVRLDNVTAALGAAVDPLARFEVEVAGVGAFPSVQRPRILWAGITGPQKLSLGDLQTATGVALRQASMVLESRAYAPHLTLGRLRREAAASDRAAIASWAQRWEGVTFGRLRIDAVNLMRSDLSVRPTQYTRIETFPLQ